MIAVMIPINPGERPGTPQAPFPFQDTDLRFCATSVSGYDATRDGRSFYTTHVISTPPHPPVTKFHIILNWLEEVRAKTSGGK